MTIVNDIKEAHICRGKIREEFQKFVKLARITREHIAHEILHASEELDIPVENMRGQGYDGASNMSSEVVGVLTCIREKFTAVATAL